MSNEGKRKNDGGPSKVFGQSMKKSNCGVRGRSAYQRQMGQSAKGISATSRPATQSEAEEKAQRAAEYKKLKKAEGLAHDVDFGYTSLDYNASKGQSRRGWVFNMLPTTVDVANDTSSAEKAALNLYCLGIDGSTFKCTVLHQPYFYILPTKELYDNKDNNLSGAKWNNLVSHVMRRFEPLGLQSVELVNLQDLDMTNHLSPSCNGRQMLKLIFDTVQQLNEVKREVLCLVQQNQQRIENATHSIHFFQDRGNKNDSERDPLAALEDIREYDVPYTLRICIDLNIRAGTWYTITPTADHSCSFTDANATKRAEPFVLAFDIECSKAPLKFPDANAGDEIFMISYMVNGKGYLVTSRTVVSKDISDFEYTPKPHFSGPFEIFNERNEEALIRRFFSHYREIKPQIVVTYNGDFFDWPFLETRAKSHGLDMEQNLGIAMQPSGEYRGRTAVHLDAFHWVRRDSYLPQGSQGLKAVTKYKLGYDPVEVDPEDMVPYAVEQPVKMATYSVSDAVATFYLYQTYVHFFIFSLCTIIPMNPEDVLRKGSGTLCEALLMVEAFDKGIICPNKQVDPAERFHNGHLVESETYIGGKVECLETGVYRSDIEYDFDMVPSAFDGLIAKVDRDLKFSIEVEGGKKVKDIENYDDIKKEITERLEELRDRPKRKEQPFVYHLDVGAMYPNIILTNRLQPNAIVDDATCAACEFNQESNNCKRKMKWVWRGEYNPASRAEYEQTKNQLVQEIVDGNSFGESLANEQAKLLSSRLKKYSKKAYNKTKVTEEETRLSTTCMRENDFYVATVLRFRDRRYELKKLTKSSKKAAESTSNAVEKKEAEDKVLIYDSLQVAHKCILNSFYGYVMRKGARWRSMEMAGVVTKTGADLITQARILVEQIGRPLELDTDGIWCILPRSFPDVYTFKVKGGGTLKLEYPCVMLNADVNANFSNHQYQSLNKETGQYSTRSECSIFFEVDGPYRCMVLPSSTEEGKLLKKRYAVFNFDGSLAELKGFELKRRGELELIKAFQLQVFERFLDGKSLEECYGAVAEIANHWMDVLDTQGESLDTEELFDLISENRNMSRQLEEYGDQKGTSQTTARRLGEFLGAEIIKDKGLNCKFIIAERPHGAPVTERAIPTAIWKAESAVKKHFLRKWLKAPEIEDFDVRNIIDWDYYRDRLAKTIQKIITIPAALQGVVNPVPRIAHPDWLHKTVARKNDRFQQISLVSMFQNAKKISTVDIEDTRGTASKGSSRPLVHAKKRLMRTSTAPPRQNSAKAAMRPKKTVSSSVVTPPRHISLSNDSFSEWLAQRKKYWRSARWDGRKTRKRVHQTTSTSTASLATNVSKRSRKPAGSMMGYLQDAALAVQQEEWQVLEIRETSPSSGEFVAWTMIGGKSLQRIQLMAPRTIYVNCLEPIKDQEANSELSLKKVERFLPHGKGGMHLYEVEMPEQVFQSHAWEKVLLSGCASNSHRMVEAIYESNTPLLYQILIKLGSVTRVAPGVDKVSDKAFLLNELTRVEKPSMDYLHSGLSYRRIFLYDGISSKSKTGVVALFIMDGGSGECSLDGNDVTRPELKDFFFRVDAKCLLWVVKPGAAKVQKAISKDQCSNLFSQLLTHIVDLAHVEEECDDKLKCLSPISKCRVAHLGFVENERIAFAGVDDNLKQYLQEKRGPTFLLANSISKALPLLRKALPNSIEFPTLMLPLPSGEHAKRMPPLNWEPIALQLCLEAYFHMCAVSFPRRVRNARFGSIPIGNLGLDDSLMLYDVSLGRRMRKARALLWSNTPLGVPDLGCSVFEAGDSSSLSSNEPSTSVWSDDDTLSPVVCNPGSYRTICVEVDIHNLAIAALMDPTSALLESSRNRNNSTKDERLVGDSTLGDAMACSLSYHLLRSMVQSWLSEAFDRNSVVADDLLHHLYRIVCTPESFLHDPALHRVIHSNMMSMFHRLLSELHLLGARIISATFSRIVIATKKSNVDTAQEYINFVIATIKKRGCGRGLDRITLRTNKLWSHYNLMDENNLSGIHLQEREPHTEDEVQWAFVESDQHFVPVPICAWNTSNYLAGGMAKDSFRAIVARFSRDAWRKEVIVRRGIESSAFGQVSATACIKESESTLLKYRKKLVSHHFSFELTRTVGEMIKADIGIESFPQLPGSHLSLHNPVLEFVKHIVQALRLDADVEREVDVLNRSLLSQIGTQEYDPSTKWQNPCADFILTDVFCPECHQSRDVNLCILPQMDGEETEVAWICQDCECPFNKEFIEWRLICFIQRRSVQYQLQDLRCTKTQAVAKQNLSKQSQTSAPLKQDVSRVDITLQLHTLRTLADFHELEWLYEVVVSLMIDFKTKI